MVTDDIKSLIDLFVDNTSNQRSAAELQVIMRALRESSVKELSPRTVNELGTVISSGLYLVRLQTASSVPAQTAFLLVGSCGEIIRQVLFLFNDIRVRKSLSFASGAVTSWENWQGIDSVTTQGGLLVKPLKRVPVVFSGSLLLQSLNVTVPVGDYSGSSLAESVIGLHGAVRFGNGISIPVGAVLQSPSLSHSIYWESTGQHSIRVYSSFVGETTMVEAVGAAVTGYLEFH